MEPDLDGRTVLALQSNSEALSDTYLVTNCQIWPTLVWTRPTT